MLVHTVGLPYLSWTSRSLFHEEGEERSVYIVENRVFKHCVLELLNPIEYGITDEKTGTHVR
jgi:hypothetical protein